MYLIGSGSITAGSLNINLPKGSYRGIYLFLTGTNASGQTTAQTEMGRLRIVRKGMDICNIDIGDMENINNVEMGSYLFSSSAGSSFDASMYYPFYLAEDQNNVLKFNSDEGTLQITFGAASTKLSSGTCSVYAVFGKGLEKYIPAWFEFSPNIVNGAWSQTILTQKNITDLYIRNALNATTIQIIRDGFTILNIAGREIRSLIATIQRMETSQNYVVIPLSETRFLSEIRSDNLQVNILGGTTGSLTAYYRQILFDVDKIEESKMSLTKYEEKKSDPTIEKVKEILQKQSPIET